MRGARRAGARKRVFTCTRFSCPPAADARPDFYMPIGELPGIDTELAPTLQGFKDRGFVLAVGDPPGGRSTGTRGGGAAYWDSGSGVQSSPSPTRTGGLRKRSRDTHTCTRSYTVPLPHQQPEERGVVIRRP